MLKKLSRYGVFFCAVLFVFGCSGFKPMSVSYQCGEPARILSCCDRNGGKMLVPNDQCSKPKNIVIFLDGTSNDWKTRTNVRRLYEIISNQDRHDIAIYYDAGVGSDFRKFFGNIFGVGFAENVRQAYRFLAMQYKPGDKIYLFGFSRGAATARSVSGMVKFIGLLDKSAFNAPKKSEDEKEREGETVDPEAAFGRDAVDDAFDVYKASFQSDFEIKLAALKKNYAFVEDDVPIRVVGVWDTVESLGFPIVSRKQKVKVNAGHRVELHDNIDYAFHALAIDERRVSFQPLLWDPEDLAANNLSREKRQKKPQVLKQVWFAGAHSDVGGGYGDSKNLSGVTLNWMLAQLETIEGYNLLPQKYRVNENLLGTKHNSHRGVFNATKEKPREELKCGQQVHSSAIQRIHIMQKTKEANEYLEWPQLFVDDADKLNQEIDFKLNNCFDVVF